MSEVDGPWPRHDLSGTAAGFHALDPAGERGLWWCMPERPALIVGSSQTVDLVSSAAAASAGVDVVRRRSGGGVVWVHPTDSVWIDVTVPRDDRLWVDDVGRSMLWLGDVLVDALSPWVPGSVHRGAFDAGDHGREVCFASTSPGEVFVGGAKLAGISQRRTRDGARLQCVIYRRWAPQEWAGLLVDPALQSVARGLSVATVDAPAAGIVSAVHTRLGLER